jgi:hypothetical protein
MRKVGRKVRAYGPEFRYLPQIQGGQQILHEEDLLAFLKLREKQGA